MEFISTQRYEGHQPAYKIHRQSCVEGKMETQRPFSAVQAYNSKIMRASKPPWLNSRPDTLKHHLAHPEISVSDHRMTQRLSLAKRVLEISRVYLDTKFWLILRDVSVGKRVIQADVDLLDVLRQLRTKNIVICPLSYSSIHELWRQDDRDSRRATAKLMDELSDAICIQPPHVLFDMELRYWLYSVLYVQNPMRQPRDLVWTKAAYYVGEPLLECDALAADQLLAMQKSIDDSMFEMGVSALVEAHAECPPRDDGGDAFAAELTRGKMEHHVASFDELYLHEIEGGLDGHKEICAEIMARLSRMTGFKGEMSEDDRAASGTVLCKLIRAAVKAGKVRTEIPQLHINASLHAALRWDRNRRYKRGDFEDFRHAGSALPYCDFVLTEKSLRHLLCNKPLSLDSDYGTSVYFDSGTAAARLSQLL
jgi:hypothetical protein